MIELELLLRRLEVGSYFGGVQFGVGGGTSLREFLLKHLQLA